MVNGVSCAQGSMSLGMVPVKPKKETMDEEPKQQEPKEETMPEPSLKGLDVVS